MAQAQAPAKEPPLDEVQWRAPAVIQHIGSLNVNTVHFYFNQSPFAIPTSNNSSLLTQAQFNQNLAYLTYNRDALEHRLRSMRGIEFVITYPPPNPSTPARPNFFILRKQLRRGPDDVQALGSYFVVNENVYQAPSVEKVIGSRVLNIARALKDVENMVRDARDKEQEKLELRDREKMATEAMLKSSLEKTIKWQDEYLEGEKRETAASSQATASMSQSLTQSQSQGLAVSDKLKSVVVGKEKEKEKKDEKIPTPVSAGGTNKKRRKSRVPGNGLTTPTTETPSGSSSTGMGSSFR